MATSNEETGRYRQLDSAPLPRRRHRINTKHWTRQQAIDYMKGEVAKWARYFSCPGQACSYMVGQLKVIELRQRGDTRSRNEVLAQGVSQSRARHQHGSADSRPAGQSRYAVVILI
jgi:hypothetical protein